ncbi:hypothetical protein [Aeromicrobium sp. CTD01-1L150]|uniref:hypothetical protein n=1 Tax=Aeromicrobium sp. CTD01-1L150 TaxID=3341830 RepID=UPI0035BF0307
MKAVHQATARYLAHLHNPLVSASRKAAVTSSFESVMSAHQDWALMWFSGVTSSLMQALPADDPWRALGGRVVGGGVDLVRPGPHGYIPDGVGAADANGAFGSADALNDLATAESPDLLSDIVYAPVVDALEPAAAAFLAFSTDGWKPAFTAATSLTQTHGAEVTSFGDDALRWACTRRALYNGFDDRYPVLVGLWWLRRADQLLADLSRVDLDSEITDEITDAAIPDGSWQMMQQPFDDSFDPRR